MRRRLSACSLAGIALVLTACVPTASSTPSSSPGRTGGVDIPVDQLPADTRCLIEHGFVLVEILPPEIEGEEPGYKLESDLSSTESATVIAECRKLAPEPPAPTEDELRVIYDRWVLERACLVDLGHSPADPPSFERFAASWASGPWMPIDGVDTSSWTDAEYNEAKERCTLEMFHRDS